ncbi:Centrosomal protein of 120 kDa [Eumeta japonica]|uniref:Centrosomal protein of 120 kDa n=1 Tax=Eumeta variegata TaxID=151549 RepID=A0A4C2AAW9_EUMVA|nr:Centrosomal protein of 120 kDa [Eumeta japonica]
MDELKGPNVQIVLHIKEGLGFGFLRSPFFVSGSLNGYLLETDPVVPSHSPVFDAELVWEADKRKFRNLRVQNVPVKVEVFSTSSQGRKDKVGYLLLSLLGAQPCPSSKIFNLRYSWHRLLGIKSEGKCCHPQLLLALSVQDRLNTPTPRNKLRMFHSNEAYITERYSDQPTVRSLILCTLKEYITESKRTASSLDLQPKLINEEGLIQIGTSPACIHLFLLSFVIGSGENIDLLLPQEPDGNIKLIPDCFVSYTVFTHSVTTDSVKMTPSVEGAFRTCAHFNQRTSLRLRSDLNCLARYFSECPYVITKLCSADKDLGSYPQTLLYIYIYNIVRSKQAGELSENKWLSPHMDALKPRGVSSVLPTSWEGIRYLMGRIG